MRQFGLTLALLYCLGSRADAIPQTSDILTRASPVDSVARALARSSFVFTGHVAQLNASTTRSVSPTSKTIVVSVLAEQDTVYSSPAGMSPLRGRSVTLVVDRASDFTVGSQSLFFAYGVVADVGIALREVARLPVVNMDRATISRIVTDAKQSLEDAVFRTMVKRSAAVLTGVVESVTPVVLPDSIARLARLQEAPVWRQAVLRVDRLFKADTLTPRSRIRVLFVSRPTRERPDAPSLLVGKQYLVGLRRFSELEKRSTVGIPPHGKYAVIDAGDVLPPADTIRIARIPR